MKAANFLGHIPVLLKESLAALRVQRGGRYIDCTVGAGGHAAAILEGSAPGGQLLGIDADPEAVRVARIRLGSFGNSVLLVNDNFKNLEEICTRHSFHPVHGIIFDLGMSSLQLEDASRGFSFRYDAPLDMRFNPQQTVTAADIVNTLSEQEVAEIIERYGEERRSRRIARYIVHNRPLRTTLELARVIEEVADGRRGRVHPATRTFQALRIVVNKELENLHSTLKQAVGLLGFDGRLVVISFHSLEDRLAKQFLHQESKGCLCPPDTMVCTCGHKPTLRLVTKGIITPSPEEIEANPRSRSARMRVAERL